LLCSPRLRPASFLLDCYAASSASAASDSACTTAAVATFTVDTALDADTNADTEPRADAAAPAIADAWEAALSWLPDAAEAEDGSRTGPGRLPDAPVAEVEADMEAPRKRMRTRAR